MDTANTAQASADAPLISGQTPLALQESKLPYQLRPFAFDSAKAALAAQRSAEVRKQRKLEAETAQEQAKQASAILHRSATDHTEVRLIRVRAMLDKLDSMLSEETDPQKIDRLASAQMRLAEQERILDNRPLPGSRRPGKETRQARPEVEPI
jgi:hypothetical protein